MKYPAMSVAANLRIEEYDRFKVRLDTCNKHEEAIERLRRIIEAAGKFEWFGIPWFEANKVQTKITLKKTEKMADIGPLIEQIEEVVGPCTSTEDDTQYESWTRRDFYFNSGPLKLRLIVEITSDNATCKRVPTGETEVVEKFKIVCEDAA